MPEWVNALNRMPVKFGQYFCKMNSYKTILSLHEFEEKLSQLRGDDELLWLDENSGSQQPTAAPVLPKVQASRPTIVASILKNQLNQSDHLGYLENLFGVKRGKKIFYNMNNKK